MAFQIKDFTSIVASMVNYVRGVKAEITDFRRGSVVRSLLEAPAIEIDELYQQMFNGLREAIPTAIYTSFGFDRVPAAAASGNVTFTASPAPGAPIVIPAGTQVKGGDIIYATQKEVIIPAGEATVDAWVVATVTGAAGNAPSGTLTTLVSPITNVTVTNNVPIISGRDEESDEERKLRFLDFIKSLSRGPVWSIEYGSRLATVTDADGNVIEYVASAKCVEPYIDDMTQPVGYIDCYIYNGHGGTSADLQAAAQTIVDGYYAADGTRVIGWKAAGIVCTVKLATEQAVAFTATVTPDEGYQVADLTSSISDAVSNYVLSLGIGDTFVLAEVIKLSKQVRGVYDVAITAPAANVVPGSNTQLVPGDITVS